MRKTKKPTSSKPKPKLSFSVDRSEFDISSDWVQAVMAQPSPPRREEPFFSPPINNATDAPSTTDERSATEALSSPVDHDVTGANSAVVEAPVAATGAQIATVAETVASVIALERTDGGREIAPVVNTATGRFWRMRPLRRITDGLTPGQYSVYSLMLTDAQSEGAEDRIYRGGYADLCRLTGLSKRGIQNVIAELQEKSVIRLHTAPGHHRLQTSAYVVPDPDVVLAAWFKLGWRFALGKSKRLTDGATVAVSDPADAA